MRLAETPTATATLTPAIQRYLLAIFVAARDVPVTPTLVARELDLSLPAASEMLGRLVKQGLLVREGPGRTAGWRVTSLGQRHIAALRRRQAVIERFLQVTLDMDPAEAAEEAASLGASVSPKLEGRLRDAVWPPERPCRFPEPAPS